MAKKDSSPRRLKGYYKFSKKYPSRRGTGYAIGESRKMKKRERSLKILSVFLLIALFAVAFVGVSLYIKLSARPLPEKKPETENTVTVENMGEIRAIYLENATLGDTDGFSRFLENAKKNGFNAVMLDFKDSNGVLTYGSSLIDIPAGYEYNAVNQAVLDRIKAEGFKVIARVYCFEDSISPQRLGAYVYEDAEKTKIWFDAPAVQGGGVWLDPVNERAQNYLCSVIKEISAFGADCIYLESVQFPTAYGGAVPVFTTDDTTLNKNQVLMQFIEKAASAAGNHPLFIGTSYDGAVGGDAEKLGGTLFDTAASVCSPLIEKPESGDYIGLIETEYAKLNNSAKNNFATLKVIPTVRNQPEDTKFYEKLSQSNTSSYIIIE
ncbi:MAG: putative glycoside hydrolase [Candidatus Fimenecus sp.]